MKVRDVDAFHISGEANIFLREDYKNNVELPGLEACIYLYDLNIETMWFNCNKEDPKVDLHFAYDSLDEENKLIAQQLEQEGKIEINYERNTCYIRFDATLDDDVEKISKQLLDIVQRFKYQDVLAPRWCLSKLDFFCDVIRNCDYDYIKLCDDFGIGYSLVMNREGEGYFFDENDNNILEKDNKVMDFQLALSNLLEAKYQEMINIGMADQEREIVFVNYELANKHKEYLDNNKGIGGK